MFIFIRSYNGRDTLNEGEMRYQRNSEDYVMLLYIKETQWNYQSGNKRSIVFSKMNCTSNTICMY